MICLLLKHLHNCFDPDNFGVLDASGLWVFTIYHADVILETLWRLLAVVKSSSTLLRVVFINNQKDALA